MTSAGLHCARAAVAALASWLTASGAFAGPAEEDALLKAAATPIFVGEWRSPEPAALAAAGTAAKRTRHTLVLTLRSGKKRIFDDRRTCAKEVGDYVSTCRDYHLVAYARSRNLFLVFEGWYEGGQCLLIDDRSGVTSKLPGCPELSPSGSAAFVAKNDALDNDFGVEIWRRRGRRFVNEWSGSPLPGGADSDIRETYLDGWRGENELRLHVQGGPPLEQPQEPQPITRARLVRGKHGWVSMPD